MPPLQSSMTAEEAIEIGRARDRARSDSMPDSSKMTCSDGMEVTYTIPPPLSTAGPLGNFWSESATSTENVTDEVFRPDGKNSNSESSSSELTPKIVPADMPQRKLGRDSVDKKAIRVRNNLAIVTSIPRQLKGTEVKKSLKGMDDKKSLKVMDVKKSLPDDFEVTVGD